MIHAGIDWAEAHHDVCIMHDDGTVADTSRIDDNLTGVARLHQRVGDTPTTPMRSPSASRPTGACWSMP